MNKPKLWTKDFISLFITNFFLFSTFYFLLVTLPVYAIQDLHGNESQAGLITTVFLISAIMIRPLAGQWVGSIGKKAVLICSLLIFFGCSLFYFFSSSMMTLLLLRFIHGIGFGMATTAAGAIVADIIPDSRKGEGMGYYVTSTNIAMVVGPFVGLTAIQQWGAGVMFATNTFCALLALGAGAIIKLPKKEQTERKTISTLKVSIRLKELFEVSAVPIAIGGAFFGIVYASILTFVSVYAKGLGLADVSSFFFVVYAIVLLLSRPFTGRWFDTYGENIIIYPALLLFAIGMYILSEAETSVIFLLSAAFIGLGWGTASPSFQTIAIQKAPPARRGLATATFLSIFDVGIGVGSFIVGLVGTKIGLSALYFYSSIFVLIGIGVYYQVHGRMAIRSTKKKQNHAV